MGGMLPVLEIHKNLVFLKISTTHDFPDNHGGYLHEVNKNYIQVFSNG